MDKIRKQMLCEKATFCYYLPKVDKVEVGATLVYPSSRSECENFKIENPSTNCQLKMKTKCIMEPKVMDEKIEFTKCKVDKDLVKFVKVCKSYRSSSIQIPY